MFAVLLNPSVIVQHIAIDLGTRNRVYKVSERHWSYTGTSYNNNDSLDVPAMMEPPIRVLRSH